MAMALEPFFLTPPPAPRHLAELRIEPAHSAVAFSAPCVADAGRKRRCLLPASSVRKRMLLELAPFDPAPSAPPPPPPTPSPTPPPSPMASRAGSSTAAEFSFAPGLRPIQPTTIAGNMFAFVAENAPMTPGRSEASGAGNMFSFLAAPERPNTPTGPTSRGGFVFAASPEGSLTPTSRGSNTSGLSFLASPNQPLTPTGPIASGRQPSLMPTGSGGASASLLSPKPARTGAADSGGFAVVPSGPALAPIGSTSSAVAKETTLPTVGLPTPSFVFSASRSPPLPRGGSKKRRRPNLRIETVPRRMSPRQWEEEETPPPQQQLTPPPQKLAKTNSSDNGEASRSGVMSGPCCLFVTSLAKAAKQEAKKTSSEASRSPAGSHCSSPARRSSLEKPSKPEQEVEVSSASCSGAEVVVRVTCKCGIHKEFSFDHHP